MPGRLRDDMLDKLKLLSKENAGQCSLVLHLKSENGGIQKIKSNEVKVSSNINFLKELRSVFDDKNVWIGAGER